MDVRSAQAEAWSKRAPQLGKRPMKRPALLLATMLCAAGMQIAEPADGKVALQDAVMDEVQLDLDNDGKTDRALLIRHGATSSADLYVYLDAGNHVFAPGIKPTIFKKDIASGAAIAIKAEHNGELTITYGCGGCSDDTATKLRLVYRAGEVVISGFTLDWDTRTAIGRCQVDFATGKGFVAEGVEDRNKQPIKVTSGPIALSAWSDDKVAEICPQTQ
jgi:hypothetical protein